MRVPASLSVTQSGPVRLSGRPLVAWLLLGLTWASCAALYLMLPGSPDQYEFDYLGWRLLEGDVPYRDLIDMNWPGDMWLHALSTALFGNRWWSWHALDFMLMAGAVGFLGQFARELSGEKARELLLFLYPVLYVGLPYWVSGQPDMVAMHLLVPAAWFHVRAHQQEQLSDQVLAGTFIALAMLMKPTLGIAAALLAVQALLVRRDFWAVALQTTVAAIGALCVLALAVAGVRGSGTTLSEFIDAIYTFNLATQFLETTPSAVLLRHFLEMHVQWWHFLTAAALAWCAWTVKRRALSIATTALPVLWLSAVLSYAVQQKGFRYHLGPAFVVLATLLPVALATVLSRVTGRGSARLGQLLLGVSALLSVYKLRANYGGLAPWMKASSAAHFAQFPAGDEVTVAQSMSLADAVRSRVTAGQSVLVFGTNSLINFLSERPQPTRFFYAPVLLRTEPPLPMAELWLGYFAADLAHNRAEVCFINRLDHENWLPSDSPAAGILRDHLRSYRRVDSAGVEQQGFVVYERVPEAP